MMVERYPNLKEEVGGLIPGCETPSVPNGKLARWSTVSCALVLAYRPSVSKTKLTTSPHLTSNTTWKLRQLRFAKGSMGRKEGRNRNRWRNGGDVETRVGIGVYWVSLSW
jgi:hypothetical protein